MEIDHLSIPPLPPDMLDTPVARVANRLHSTAIHLLRRVRIADKDSGLTPERLSLLSVLAFAGPRTVSELADIEMVSRPAISRILNALEEDGLVRRTRPREDRRKVVVRSTGAGRAVIDQARTRRLERLAEDLAALSSKELQSVDQALALLVPDRAEDRPASRAKDA